MLDTTTSNILCNTTQEMLESTVSSSPNTTVDSIKQSKTLKLVPSRNYSCNTCHTSFPDGQQQRIHMKDSLHLMNLRRRVDGLEPFQQDVFDIETCVDTRRRPTPQSKHRVGDEGSTYGSDVSKDSRPDQMSSPWKCLFCDLDFSDEDTLDQNVHHMKEAHGFSIPGVGAIGDLEGLLTYLAEKVQVWHECSYRGIIRLSSERIQNHMRDKSHCLLNFYCESDLPHFWSQQTRENVETDAPLDGNSAATISSTEMRFASGKVIASRHSASTPRKLTTKSVSSAMVPHSVSRALQPADLEELISRTPYNTRQLARRDELSIVGISTQQRQALVLAEKKAQRSDAMARRAREWVYARGSNLQKHDQIDTTGKKGKQNHKLQPR